MSIVFFGSPDFAVPSLEALIGAGETVAIAVTQPDKARGRGKVISQCPVKQCALGHGIRTLTPRSMKDEAFLAEIEGVRPGFIVAVAYGKILPPRILRTPSVAPVNVHASLLPKYRGAAPIAWALMNGESISGVTTMLMAEGLDTGDILLQEEVPIGPGETTGTLSQKLSVAGGELLLRTLRGMRDGSITPRPQGKAATEYARMLTKDDGHIDWSATAAGIHNLVRAFSPWPSAYCFDGKRRLKLLRTKALDETTAGAEPGRVVDLARDHFDVAAGKGKIRVLELQPEGKRAMSARDFLAGSPVKKGTVLQ